jgi:hypothetical protein
VLPFWATIRPLSHTDRHSMIRLSESEVRGYTKVPHAWAHAEVLHRYLDDASLDRFWRMIIDHASAFCRRFGCKITAERKTAWRQFGEDSSDLQRRATADFREHAIAFTRRAWRGAWGADDEKSLETTFDAAVAAGTAAAAGDLSDPERLRAQLDRMCGDKRILRFAHEFFGQWLGFSRFDRHARPDRDRYPAYTVSIRQAMHDEAVAWCADLVVNQRPITDLLTANHDRLRLPILLAASAGCGLKTGRALSYPIEDEGARRLSNLYLSLHDHYGIEADRSADSTGLVANL